MSPPRFRDAIQQLTAELKLTRLAITAMHTTIQDVIDPSAGENAPGYIRVVDIKHED